MYIYNFNQDLQSLQHILDPDYLYHTSYEADILYHFFKSLIIPKNVDVMVSLYIEFEIHPYLFEKYPYIYQKFSVHIQKLIVDYLDFGHANLFHNQPNMFYIIMFDVNEEQINQSFIALEKKLKQKIFTYHDHPCQIDIKCGVYFSHTYIHPFDFYKCAQDQFQNTLQHKETILSIKNLSVHE